MPDGISDPVLVALIGFAGGILLGLAARLGRYCTLGAIEDHLYQGSSTRLGMWILSIGLAGVLVFAMAALGWFDTSLAIYHLVPFSPIAHIVGGLLFGYGMSMAGNCGFGALARAGGGDLRSFVIILVMGISAYVMLSGPFAEARLALVEASALDIRNRGYANLLSSVTGLPEPVWGIVLSLSITVFALSWGGLLTDQKAIFWSGIVAMAIASGWLGTQWVANTGFIDQPVLSHTFTAPTGETMLFLMTSSAGGLSFGVGSVFGVLSGAFIGSLIKGHFRWEACEDPRELRRQFLGSALMGFGAVIAMGCTIGQGVSAFSVMAYGAPLTLAGIFAGAALGLRHLIEGFVSAR